MVNREPGVREVRPQRDVSPLRDVSVTVVIPVRDGATTILDQLRALDTQSYDDFDIIVADNGSTDETIQIVANATTWLAHDLRLIDASDRRGAAHARNHGARASDSAYVLFCDADDVVGPNWVEGHLRCLEQHQLSTGPVATFHKHHRELQQWASTEPEYFLGQAPFAASGNLGVDHRRFELAGGFDEEVALGEDVDLSVRMLSTGATLGWSDDAVLHIRDRGTTRELVRQRYRWGQADVDVFVRHAGSALHRPPIAQQLLSWRALARLTLSCRSKAARRKWLKNAAHRAGRIRGSIRHRTLLI